MDRTNADEPCSKKPRIENGDGQLLQLKELLPIPVKDVKNIKVGSRKSQLALFQSNYVVDLLRKKYTGISYDIITMSTTGDKILDVALSKIGEKSLFTKELEVALDKGEIDIIVHSLKDLPTTLPPNMVIGAICEREDPSDVVLFKTLKEKEEGEGTVYKNLKDLPPGSIVGTSSLRRIAQLRRLYPNLKFNSIRGNLNTRFRKLDEEDFSAIVLAAAGVNRLGYSDRITQYLQPEQCMYAVGQGAIAVECKSSQHEIIDLLTKISDQDTILRCIAERAFMRKLEGGCSVPVAVYSTLENKELTLKGGVFSLDGSQRIIQKLCVKLSNAEGTIQNHYKPYVGVVAPHVSSYLLKAAESLGTDLAEVLLKKGAGDILKEAKNNAINKSL